MESPPPATADEADDSYRTLGVGRSSPGSHDTQAFGFVRVADGHVGRSRLFERGCRMRALLTDHGFTISVFIAVAITAIFAFVLEASQELVATLLISGILTAA